LSHNHLHIIEDMATITTLEKLFMYGILLQYEVHVAGLDEISK
jgi:hypothetical protein